jgi:hypothetical protein
VSIKVILREKNKKEHRMLGKRGRKPQQDVKKSWEKEGRRSKDKTRKKEDENLFFLSFSV